MYRVVDLITKKRDGERLTKDEINFIINGYVDGSIPDYQVSALLMAIYYNPLDDNEIWALTDAMLKSGEQIDLSKITGIKVDKHSTGGVGDKTSLVIGPIVAAAGVKIAKMSGRGLGHTGGTLDKLESIPGCTIEIDGKDFIKQVNEIGLAIIGQTANITPADKKLYALRDVTATVDSIGLIASSIMSKKLASGADHIVLDVKVGSGAFMKNLEEATTLAETMVKIGKNVGRETVAVMTDMEQPLGNAVGNSLEVIEAIETLKGNGPKDFTELCKVLASEILLIAKIAKDVKEAETIVDDIIRSGKGLEKLKEMISYQHGNPEVINDYSLFKQASEEIELIYLDEEDAYVDHIDALMIGEAAMNLGAGRATKEDVVDHSVGIVLHKKVGDKVSKNDSLATIYANDLGVEVASNMVMEAYQMSKKPTSTPKVILKIVR
ncbi:MAG: pyrimidine-nucleoside phosphorylase [Bacilli bacterium]|nr:pyrimidine-nucleoside phosphorylase [Bacilli bacterium]